MELSKVVCVYGGSADGARPSYVAAATALGASLAASRLGLVYGGAKVGLMGRVADAALAGGGTVVGVMPTQLRRYEVEHVGLTELLWTDDLHARKRVMAERADAFVVLPGGYGTLDEALETINMKQLRAHAKPIVLVDTDGFFDKLVALFDVLAADGFAYAAATELCRVVKGADDVVPALLAAWRHGDGDGEGEVARV